MARILVFGDSIPYGAWDKQGGWVYRLRQFLDGKNLSDLNTLPDLVYNLGVSGETTEGLLERFEFETKQRQKEGVELIFIFEIGINDSQFIHSENAFNISLGELNKNVQELINIAQKFSSKIVFVGLTPVEEVKVNPIPWNLDMSYKNEYIQKYDQIIKQVCEKNNVYFIEIFEDWIKLDYKKLLEDGLHPNSAGHQKIFETVKNFLIRNKIIKI